jgi:hypothetical protein
LNGYGNWEQRLNSTECINRTVFVGALHGMMTAYALARICHELFGDVEYAAIDTDRNKYPIGELLRLFFDWIGQERLEEITFQRRAALGHMS